MMCVRVCVCVCVCTGFTEKEFDDVKGIFLDTNLMLLLLTIFISFFHVRCAYEAEMPAG